MDVLPDLGDELARITFVVAVGHVARQDMAKIGDAVSSEQVAEMETVAIAVGGAIAPCYRVADGENTDGSVVGGG